MPLGGEVGRSGKDKDGRPGLGIPKLALILYFSDDAPTGVLHVNQFDVRFVPVYDTIDMVCRDLKGRLGLVSRCHAICEEQDG